MNVLSARCAGIDVHQKQVSVCVRLVENARRRQEIRTYETYYEDLLALDAWLTREGVTEVAMESTGVYWKPLWNVLEGHFKVVLVNAQHLKRVPGRKTDVKDCEWLAELLSYGLLKPSFIPPQAQRELRQLTRYRMQLVQEHTANVNRVHQVLEDGNIKLGMVATDIMGVSGREILEAMIAGIEAPGRLAALARGRLRAKGPALRKALTGRVSDHHRQLLEWLLRHLEELEQLIGEIGQEIQDRLAGRRPGDRKRGAGSGPAPTLSETPAGDESQPQSEPGPQDSETPAGDESQPQSEPSPQDEAKSGAESTTAPPEAPLGYDAAVVLAMTVPGISRRNAEVIVAELGPDMKWFGDAAHLSSWVGLAPGNYESAGKRHSSRITKGNRWLRQALVEGAQAAARTKDHYLSALYRRLTPRRGKKRAIVAVAHSILVSLFHMFQHRVPYHDLGADYFDTLNPEGTVKYYLRRLTELGYQATLQPLAPAATAEASM